MNTLTRAKLVAKLQEDGYSYRTSREIVKVTILELTRELKETGILELPFGTLTLIAPNPTRAYQLNKLVMKNTKPKVHFRKKG